MTQSTFERFNYALRPAKNIERKMLCEAFARLARIAPLSTYRYVGFGALGFYDFSLFHQRLGINDMISIESHVDARERVSRNVPYSCIEVKWGMSNQVLPLIEWSKRSIVWLDYDSPLDDTKLSDIAYIAANVVSGSILVVTLPVDPGDIGDIQGLADRRLASLRDRVGKGNIPDGVDGNSLKKWGQARVSRQIIDNHLRKVLSDRNAPFDPCDRVDYNQLFNFHYADGVKMLSAGGIILNPEDETAMNLVQFSDLEFYRPGKEEYLIESPLLTWREIKVLDEMLPGSAPEVAEPTWIPEAERRKYGRVYRYFPSFSEVEN